jgi:hypothetical protein
MKLRYFLALLFLLIPLGSASSFNSSTLKLDKSYSSGEAFRGTINFTVIDYPGSSLFTSSTGNSITLLDFLRANSIASPGGFNCSTINCSRPYTKQEKISSILLRNSNVSIGLTLDGLNVNSVHDAQIAIKSDMSASCYLPLTVVLGDKDGVRISPTSYKDVPCTGHLQGCFDTNAPSYVTPVIPYNGGHYCEKIALPAAPAYRLGATVIQSTSGSAKIRMTLYAQDGTSLDECLLPDNNQSVQTTDCLVRYSSPVSNEYYVCIEATSSSNYKIKAENNNSCGTNTIGGSFLFDYDIYAVPLQFSTPSVTINDSMLLELQGKEFSSWIQDYVLANYNNKCDPSCIIPIAFEGGDQTVSVSNVNIQYDVDGAEGLVSKDVYSIAQGDTRVTGKGMRLDLSKGGFIVPLQSTNHFIIGFDGNTIVDSAVNVTSGFDFSITPLAVPYGVPIAYRVLVENVSKTKWNFGDSSDVVSNDASATHSFLEQGMHNISVEVTLKNNSMSRKRFSIYVGDVKEGAGITLGIYQKRLDALRMNISSYPAWIQTALSTNLNVTAIGNKLVVLQSAYSKAQNDSDYVDVMTQLLTLDVPAQLVELRKETLPMAASFATIDTSLAESASGESITDASQFASNLAYWNRKYISSTISLRELGAAYDSGVRGLVTLVSVDVKTLADVPEPMFLVFSYSPADLMFSQDYNQKSVTGGTSIALQGSKTFDFAVPDSVTVQKLGAYILPQNIRPLLEGSSEEAICRVNAVCESDLGENADNCPLDCGSKTNKKLIISLLVLFVVAAGVAAFIWTWYKKRFERTLFKNPSDFYNITMFIQNSRRAGVKDTETKKKLKKVGWNFDQIHYAFSKTKPSTKPSNVPK